MTSKETTLAAIRPSQNDINMLPTINVGLTNLQGFELVQRAAKLLASSTLVPKDYQNNMPNCVVALNMAARMGADPLMIMQNLVPVHGRPSWSSQFLIATVNTCGRFSALRYEFFGKPGEDTWGCRAWAIEKATNEKLVGTDITIAIAKKEGWYGKNGSKWQSIPQQMLMYRAGSWWTRAYAPELSMGLHTAEEAYDIVEADKRDDGTYAISTEVLRENEKECPAGPDVLQTAEVVEHPVKNHVFILLNGKSVNIPEEMKPIDLANAIQSMSDAEKKAFKEENDAGYTQLLDVIGAANPKLRDGIMRILEAI